MTDIVHIISGLGGGGAENMLSQLAPRLSKNGMSQAVISLTGDGVIAARLEADGIPVLRLDFRNVQSRTANFVRLLLYIQSLRPKLLQGWMYHGDLAASVAHILVPGKKRRRLVWGIRCSNMDTERNAKVISWSIRLSNIPDAIVANSEAGARVHLSHGYPDKKMKVVFNGVDTDRFRPHILERARLRAQLGLSDDAIVAVHAARVDPMKDHETLLAAAERTDGLKLVLIGHGTSELIARHPQLADKVQALGRREDIPSLLAIGDIVISSSAYGEGFSNAIAEGMASGLVPVVTDVGDAARIVGHTGIIVKPSDPAALSQALEKLVAAPRHELRKSGELARARIKEKFEIHQMTERFKELYLELNSDIRFHRDG